MKRMIAVAMLLLVLTATSAVGDGRPCGNTLPGGWVCILEAGHAGLCLWVRGGPVPDDPPI